MRERHGHEQGTDMDMSRAMARVMDMSTSWHAYSCNLGEL